VKKPTTFADLQPDVRVFALIKRNSMADALLLKWMTVMKDLPNDSDIKAIYSVAERFVLQGVEGVEFMDEFMKADVKKPPIDIFN
jgi:hypothetical protein